MRLTNDETAHGTGSGLDETGRNPGQDGSGTTISGKAREKASPRYSVVCGTCYTCIVGKTNSRRDADRMATGHMSAYGHNVWIQDGGPRC
jgi:hypothetical protein